MNGHEVDCNPGEQNGGGSAKKGVETTGRGTGEHWHEGPMAYRRGLKRKI